MYNVIREVHKMNKLKVCNQCKAKLQISQTVFEYLLKMKEKKCRKMCLELLIRYKAHTQV